MLSVYTLTIFPVSIVNARQNDIQLLDNKVEAASENIELQNQKERQKW